MVRETFDAFGPLLLAFKDRVISPGRELFGDIKIIEAASLLRYLKIIQSIRLVQIRSLKK